MTYNIGGGRKDFGSELDLIAEIVNQTKPDILVLQEVIRIQQYDGTWSSSLEDIIENFPYAPASSYYAPSLTLREHLYPSKNTMVHSLFQDHLDWQQGNAIVSRWPFHRLGERHLPGSPRTIPIFRPKAYMGNRDTEPRNAIIGRIGCEPIFPIIVGLHLTTLVNERGRRMEPDKREEAVLMREMQAKQVINLLKTNALEKGEVVFVMGDINATVHETTISSVLIEEGGFVRIPMEGGKISTHPKMQDAIDHILVFPKERLVDHKGYVIDSDKAQKASDHLPIVADITIAI